MKQEAIREALLFQLPNHLARLLVDPGRVGVPGSASEVGTAAADLDEE